MTFANGKLDTAILGATFYEPRYKDGKIVALADVALAGGIIVKGFRVLRGERGLTAAVPSRPFTVQGRTRYYNQVVFSSPDLRKRFLSYLVNAYELWEKDRQGQEAGGPDSHPPADELVE